MVFILIPSGLFQSTRPSRGATQSTGSLPLKSRLFQSTRPSRGATETLVGQVQTAVISIHAPLAGRDPFPTKRPWKIARFQSTRPSRGATFKRVRGNVDKRISIHAPLAGRDIDPVGQGRNRWDFNPRAPRGARPLWRSCSLLWVRFQSTRPSRGATDAGWKKRQSFSISIHAPLAGRDSKCAQKSRTYLR